jgi:hypothetical protein
MRNLLILAVAASFAVACAGRTEDDMGAAPEGADTTRVIDDTTAVIADTAQTYPTDTTMGQVETDTGYVQQDTTLADPGMSPDTVGAQGEIPTGDTTGYLPGDTTGAQMGDTTGAWTDTTAVEPTDTTLQQ